MTTYYVYDIINSMGVREHVGHTTDLKYRWYQHTKFNNYNSSTQGKFKDRDDVQMVTVATFNTKVDAENFEKARRIQFGIVERKRKRTTFEQACQIRNAYAMGISIKDLTFIFDKSMQVIHAILDNQTCHDPNYRIIHNPK